MVIRTSPRPQGRVHPYGRVLALLSAAVALVWADPAYAYIGPGAGFAFAGSLLAMIAAIGLAVGSILLWPFTVVYRWLRVGNPFKHAQAKRIVIMGLDGMDPGMATKLMLE